MAMQVISFRCVLKNRLGQTISSSYNQGVLSGDDGHLQNQSKGPSLGRLGRALSDIRKGEKRRVSLSAKEAYGYYDPKLVIRKSLEDIDMSEPVKLGEQVTYISSGVKSSYRVSEISDEHVLLDGNHPLAGQDLVFEIEALDVRDATEEEWKLAR